MRSEFNLIEEPWILVREPNVTVRAVSLKEALLNAHQYVALAGELPTQDVAVLRLLLAVLYTIFSQVDENGDEAELLDEDKALDRWEALWEGRQFPSQPICDYLDRWKDRFWLFDEKYPFYQVPEASCGTSYEASKLNGELSESSNKVRLFPSRTSATKNQLSYAEAARWLLYVNAYDDTSAKPKQKGLPSPGVGWLGKLGLIYVAGDNLFETLMLNLTFLKNGQEMWDANDGSGVSHCPAWELNTPHTAERKEISLPNHLSELLTLQSRRLFLVRNGESVVGYTLLGGDFFQKANADSEQMTIWVNRSDEKKGITLWQPKRHDAARQLWRDFSAIAVQGNGNRTPGIVSWIARLKSDGLLAQKTLIRFQIASVQYGDKDFFVNDAFSDALTFHSGLLTELGAIWCDKITAEIQLCNRVADAVGTLAKNLEKAAGGSGDGKQSVAKTQLYARIDAPFRQWLQQLEPEQNDADRYALIAQWRKEIKKIAGALAQEMVDEAGQTAFVGRFLQEKSKNKNKKSENQEEKRHCSAPEAYNLFLWKLKHDIYQEG